jgi:hypothetical protein
MFRNIQKRNLVEGKPTDEKSTVSSNLKNIRKAIEASSEHVDMRLSY